MERRFSKAQDMKKITRSTELVHEGRYMAEVPVDLIETAGDWSPYLSIDDAEKLDKVRSALRAGDLKAAAALASVFELTPIAAE
jgi:hypothetical protein